MNFVFICAFVPLKKPQFPLKSTGKVLEFLIKSCVATLISEMLHQKISLSLVPMLLLVNFVSGFRLELIYISLIESVKSNLTHLHGFQLLVLLPQFIEITFFHLYQQNKSSESKVKFRQASNRCKRVLEAAKLVYATKTKESITSQKLGSQDFW